MITEFLHLIRDSSGYNTFGRKFTPYSYQCELPMDTDTTLTIPSNYPSWLAYFTAEPGATVWVNLNDTAAYPVTGSFVLDTSQIISTFTSLEVDAGDVLHFITPNTSALIGVSLYAVQEQ